MTFEQAKKLCKQEICERLGVNTWVEALTRMSKTDIRCYWVDFVDYLVKDKQVSEKIAFKWGQII